MKNTLFILILASLFIISCKTGVENDSGNSTTGFEIKKGLNVSHWLSQTEKRGEERENYIKEEDFIKIASMGFDHVRIPIDEMHMWDEAGNKHNEAFQLLHNAINWSFENDLRVIVDLHVLRSHHFNTGNQRLWTDTTAQRQFWGFWDQLSEELSQYPNDKLAYELMNEAVAEDPEDWNKLIAKGIQTVRQKEPERPIVVGSNKWQMVFSFKDLKIPEDDENLILSFHFYDPFILTHYKAPWTGILAEYEGEVQYPGYTVDPDKLSSLSPELAERLKEANEDFNPESIEKRILLAKTVADKYGLPLYCGEFGCFPTTPIEIRQKLYSDLMTIFDKHDIAWCHWNYKNDFPVVDKKTLEPVEEIVDILIAGN